MATQSDRIRDEILQTRRELAEDVDRLADRANPKRVVSRGWEGVKDGARSVKDKVMGVSESAASSLADAASSLGDRASNLGDTASDVGDSLRRAPKQLVRTAQGNPLAVGVIAFGGGMLAAALIPVTEAERRVGEQIAEHRDDLVEPLREAGREMRAELGDAVRAATAEVKSTAQDAVTHTMHQLDESGRATVRSLTDHPEPHLPPTEQ